MLRKVELLGGQDGIELPEGAAGGVREAGKILGRQEEKVEVLEEGGAGGKDVELLGKVDVLGGQARSTAALGEGGAGEKDVGVLGRAEGGLDLPEGTTGAEQGAGKLTIGGNDVEVLEGPEEGVGAPENENVAC